MKHVVNIHEAKTNLSKLTAAVEAGDEVVIARDGKPVVDLVRHTARIHREPGALLATDPHWADWTFDPAAFAPLTDEEAGWSA